MRSAHPFLCAGVFAFLAAGARCCAKGSPVRRRYLSPDSPSSWPHGYWPPRPAARTPLPSSASVGAPAGDADFTTERPGKPVGDLWKAIEKETPERLARLAEEAEDSRAVWARWHLMRLASREAGDLLNLIQAGEFLGWLEGKYRVRVPDWWRLTFAAYETNLSEKGSERFWEEAEKRHPSLFARKAYSWFEPLPMQKSGPKGPYLPRGVVMKIEGRSVLLEQRSLAARVDRAVFEAEDGTPLARRFRIRVAPEAVLLCGTDGIGSPSTLRCVDPVSGKLRWERSTWAINTKLLVASGSWFHNCDLVVSKGRAFVFGCVNGTVYLESFDLETGRCLFRFASNGWGLAGDNR